MGNESDIVVPRTTTPTDIVITGVEYSASAGELTLIASSGGFDATGFASSFDPAGISYLIDGAVGSGYALVSSDVDTATASTDGRELKLVLTASNGLSNHSNAADLLDAGTSTADTVVVSSATGIADTTSAITVTAAAAPSATAIGGVDFDTGTNTLTVVGAAGGVFDDTMTADVTAISITLNDNTAVTIATSDLDGSVRANNAGGLDIPLVSSFAHIGALSDADADTISIADTFISGVSAATDLTIHTTDSTARPATDIVITGVEYSASAGELTLIASSGGFDATGFASSFDPAGISYLIDGAVGSGYALVSSDVDTATASTDGRELKLVLTASNGLSNHSNAADLLDAGTSTADTVVVSSATGIADTTSAITVTAAAAPSATAIGGVDFDTGTNTLTVVGAAGGVFDDTMTADVTAISITLNDNTAVTIATSDLDGSVRANNAGGLDIPLVSSFAHIGALSDADADTISIADTFISGVSAATDLTINVTGSRPTNIDITSVEFHAGAGMLTLKAAAGSFDDAFATDLEANYSSGFTYTIDGARETEVNIAAGDISSISASNSSGSVSALNILLTPGNNALVNHTNATNLLDGNSSAADTFTITSVAGLTNLVAETVLPHSGGSSGGSGITIGGADFDPHTNNLILVPDHGSSTFPSSASTGDFDVTAVSIQLHGASSAVPLATTDVAGIQVNSNGAAEITFSTDYVTANATALSDSDADTVSVTTSFYTGVNATSSPLQIAMGGGGHSMVYPADATAYTGSIFETLGTETWASSTVTPPSNYKTDLSGDGVTSNSIDARQEQLVADIVGALVDELKEFKDGGNVVPGTPSTTENHPLFIVTDQAAGTNVDEVILVEEGYMVYIKGQFDTDQTATQPTAQITGAVTSLAAYVDVSDSTTPPTADSSAIIDVDLTGASITFEGIIQNDIV